MFDYSDNPIDSWWISNSPTSTEIFPGRCALFVGAGISIASPTCLPPGGELTSAMLEHLLDGRAAEEIIEVFQQCSPILRKSLPRLEHVLDQAFSAIEGDGFSRAGDPKALLKIFLDRPPNALHRAIADYLVEHRTWCITTNFDDCIERAASFRIPVHVLSADQATVEVLHPEFGADWGIVKLHGSIEQGVGELGATLQQLQIGLAAPMQSLLARVIDEVDLLVVAGYSGTDHFDINHWMRRRRDDARARLIWISHKDSDQTEYVHDDQREPGISWSGVFNGTKNPEGRTSKILQDLLGLRIERDAGASQPSPGLKSQLAQLYMPSTAEKYFNGARLATAIGMGQLAEEQLRLLQRALNDKHAALGMAPGIYLARGMTAQALAWHDGLARENIRTGHGPREKFLRLEGRRMGAILHFFRNIGKYRSLAPVDAASSVLEASAAALSIIADLQGSAVFRSRFARSLCLRFIHYIWARVDLGDFSAPIAFQGRVQTQNLHIEALLLDDDDGRLLSRMSNIVADQYVNNGTLFPAEHFIEKSTALEEDRLADLVLVNLDMASIILAALRRRWPKGIHEVWEEEDSSSHGAVDFLGGTTASSIVFDLLLEASKIAAALQAYKLQVMIANHWIKADDVLKGVSYWKAQRLYMPHW